MCWLKVFYEIAVILVPSSIHLAFLVYFQQNIEELVIALTKVLGIAIFASVASDRLQLAKKEFRYLIELLFLLLQGLLTVRRHDCVRLKITILVRLVFLHDLLILQLFLVVLSRRGARFNVVRNTGQKDFIKLCNILLIPNLDLVARVINDCF